jgi:inner membrane protein
MIIGHLPAGYFLTRYLIKNEKIKLTKFWLALGLIAAILPDFDYAYWFLTDDNSVSHRGYITTYPAIYFAIFLIFLLIYLIKKNRWFKNFIIIVFGNIFLHFLLDTPFYGVKWFWPFCNQYLGIYDVGSYAAGTGIQVMNYFTHWYWYLEITLWVLAIISIVYSYKKRQFKD